MESLWMFKVLHGALNVNKDPLFLSVQLLSYLKNDNNKEKKKLWVDQKRFWEHNNGICCGM